MTSQLSSLTEDLLTRAKKGDVTVGIVGLGYVGQPLVLCFAEAGLNVIGFDVNVGMVDDLNAGKSRIEHISDARIAAVAGTKFKATTDYSEIGNVDAIIICVPTPLNRNREPDMSYVRATMASIEPNLRAGHFISLESTTFPGTIDDEVLPAVERRGLQPGEDVFVAYSPEREDPGNKDYGTRTIPKLIGGYSPQCSAIGSAIYSHAIETMVPVSSPRVAELAKLLENIQRSVNIGLVNEMKIIADKMDIDIHEVVAAAATKPFGFTAYYPGPGLGGHCIPIDPFYLTWKAREYGVNTRFIELAGEINRAMPEWVFGKISGALNERGKPVKGSRILALGIAYKKNIDDMRESPAVMVMEHLRDAGALLEYSDPHVLDFPEMREHKFDLSSRPLSAEMLKSYDCVVLLTDHDDFDYDLIIENSSLMVDSRGKYRDAQPNLVKA